MIWLSHELTSSAAFNDLRRRAPAINVNHIGAEILHHHCGISHTSDVITEDLNTVRALLLSKSHHLKGSPRTTGHPLYRDKLTHHEAYTAWV
jgi:hypothetical protein